MIIKMNGVPVDAVVTENGVNVSLDISQIIHTPINVDIAYAGHHLINGDINMINFWGHAYDNAVNVVSNLF